MHSAVNVLVIFIQIQGTPIKSDRIHTNVLNLYVNKDNTRFDQIGF